MSRKVCRDTVLVIDDDPDFRALIETIAELCMVPTLQAPDCRKGLKILECEHGRIKMVFLDYFMPGMEPVKCAAAIIATAPPCEVPTRSNLERPNFSTKRRRRSATARMRQSSPGGRSEKPDPSMSGAYTVAYGASAGMVYRQENE